ncbi:MAG: 2-succinyl-5-enolpyruvyl-6-hydroxy-3-cyclohexene-1-carboxylic-acid synthase [Chloroflexota bacterium]|nr:MAG: 2-succinyl-5-enolpyruvyl-6-hydroxy-3-cyclohexene-1-carboxylic-acid synthase [Chloroflexota bacterium]
MNLSHENITWLYVRAFVDELARSGIRHVCLCPGSRSTPLAMTFADDERFRLWMHLDERSCAFFALGLAKASREPVVLVCTSGTAAANFFPAIVEASLARVPLIVLTADRPPELRDTGAAQTIDQIKIYGAYAKWFAEIALPEANVEMLRYARTFACRAVAQANETPAGVVHFNMPFREPLVPSAADFSVSENERDAFFGRADGKAFVEISRAKIIPDEKIISTLAQSLAQSERGLIVAGMQNDAEFSAAVTKLANALGYPILADPLSQVRCGEHCRENVMDSYDAFMRDARMVKELAPEIVLRFGAIPTSKPVLQYLQQYATARQILIDDGGWNEPAHIASEMIRSDAVLFCDALSKEISAPRAKSAWLEQWQTLNTRTKSVVNLQLATLNEFFEGRVFSELTELLPDRATCFLSSSMPVRDADTFLASNARNIRFLSNRGANGIDGVVSTALGAGAASEGKLVLVIGDLALYHDLNGLLAAKLHKLNALIILLNNDGGGIFSFLPQATHPKNFEKLFGTPHGLNFEHAAKMYDANFVDVKDWDEFRAAVTNGLRADGLNIVQVKTNRETNVTMHRAVWRAVSNNLGQIEK